jgi:hypothetical protein
MEFKFRPFMCDILRPPIELRHNNRWRVNLGDARITASWTIDPTDLPATQSSDHKTTQL